MRPKITLLTLDYPPMTGGVARYLAELVEASQEAIDVLTPQNARFFGSFWPRWAPLVSRCLEVRKAGRSVFVSHVLPVGTAAWIARRLGGSSYVVLFHGRDLRLIRGPWRTWLCRRICGDAAAVMVNSESTRRDLARVVGSTVAMKAHVVTPGLKPPRKIALYEVARQELGVEADTFLVLSVARLVRRKGIDRALGAVARVRRQNPGRKIRYAVVGDGADAERLEKIRAEHGIDVTWVHGATDEDVQRWFSASDLFLLPARDEAADVEGFGIVFLEAAFHGLPVVAGRAGGVPEAVVDGGTGILVDPTDEGEIAEAIEKLAGNGVMARRLGENGRKRVEAEFRWSDRWEKVKALFETT